MRKVKVKFFRSQQYTLVVGTQRLKTEKKFLNRDNRQKSATNFSLICAIFLHQDFSSSSTKEVPKCMTKIFFNVRAKEMQNALKNFKLWN